MKLKNKFFAVATALPLMMGGLASCEDSCNNCNCDAFVIDYVASSDSLSQLSQLSSEQTVVIKGSGLSMTKEVYLVDSVGTQYFVALNPTMVTDNNIIITLDCDANLISTEKLLLVSSGGCRREYAISKPVPAPSIKLFYSEFVPDGDTLRVFGSAFIDDKAAKDTLKVWFQDAAGNPIYVDSFKIEHDGTELLIPVPAGVANSTPLTVQNSHGTGVSPMLFRDSRNIFLDFDTEIASDWRGAMDTFAFAWNPDLATDAEKYQGILNAIGGFPKGCNGYYNAMTTSDAWQFTTGENQIFMCPATEDPTKPQRNLLGDFIGYNIESLVLKFEVYVPEAIPYASNMYIIFTEYGSELADGLSHYGNSNSYIPRDYTKNGSAGDDFTEGETAKIACITGKGVPAAWFHPGSFNIDEDGGSATVDKPFYTEHGWMTVTIPLSSDVFKYAVSDRSITTTDNYLSCGHLAVTDFYNFYMNTDDDKSFQKSSNKKRGLADLGNSIFVAFDNFRIVPDDQGGARFSKYYGVTSGSKYPY